MPGVLIDRGHGPDRRRPDVEVAGRRHRRQGDLLHVGRQLPVPRAGAAGRRGAHAGQGGPRTAATCSSSRARPWSATRWRPRASSPPWSWTTGLMVKIHPTALVAEGAELADGVERRALLHHRRRTCASARDRSCLSHVVIENRTTIGEDCSVRNFANLGGPPHHTGYKGEPTELVIGDRNKIWEHVTMHIGTPDGGGVTRVGDDGMFMATEPRGPRLHGRRQRHPGPLRHPGRPRRTWATSSWSSGLAAVTPGTAASGRYRLHRRPGGGDQGRDPVRLGVGQPRPPRGPEPGRA